MPLEFDPPMIAAQELSCAIPPFFVDPWCRERPSLSTDAAVPHPEVDSSRQLEGFALQWAMF
jgi:hypothetical protein